MKLLQMKKSQISMFLLIGVLLLGVTIIVLVLIPSQVDEDFLQRQSTESANVDTIKTLIQSCVETSAENVLFQIGMQGGRWYEGENADSSFYSVGFRYQGQMHNVGFGLTRKQNEIPPPYYPSNIPSQSGYGYTLDFLRQNFFGARLWGQNELPKLCSRFGPNNPTNNASRYSCDVGTYGNQNTIQDILHREIQQKIFSCVTKRDDVISETVASLIQTRQDVEVLLGDTTVRVTYSIDGSITQSESVIEIPEIQVTLPIRLKRIYNLAHYMIENDLVDVSFLFSQNYNEIQSCRYFNTSYCWDEHMDVSIIRNTGVDHVRGFDIVEIIDRESLVLGNPYRFLFAVENRRPMLEYMDFDGTDTRPTFVSEEGRSVRFEPIGYDPDGDSLTYSYQGWLAEYLNSSTPYTLGTHCGQMNQCANATIPMNETGLFVLNISVLDSFELRDYQPIYIKVYGEGTNVFQWNDPVGSCPAQIPDYELVVCESADCVCEEGQYCIDSRPHEDTSLDCKPGSKCCTYNKDANFEIICTSAECFGTSDSGDIDIMCDNGADCRFNTTMSISGVCKNTDSNVAGDTMCTLSNIGGISGCDDFGISCTDV